jgi:hypothetical protein
MAEIFLYGGTVPKAGDLFLYQAKILPELLELCLESLI